MKRILLLAGVIGVMIICRPISAAPLSLASGAAQITVVNSSGGPVLDAPIYIFGQYVPEIGDLRSGDTVQLPEGDYDLSAAWIQRTNEGIIPQVSPRAHIHITPGDTVSVILPLTSVMAGSDAGIAGPLAFSSH